MGRLEWGEAAAREAGREGGIGRTAEEEDGDSSGAGSR